MSEEICIPEGINAFRASFIHDNLDHLLGEVLTVIDAAVTEPTQNKAIKDIIRKHFSKKHDWVSEASFMEIERTKDAPSDAVSRAIVKMTPEQR